MFAMMFFPCCSVMRPEAIALLAALTAAVSESAYSRFASWKIDR